MPKKNSPAAKVSSGKVLPSKASKSTAFPKPKDSKLATPPMPRVKEEKLAAIPLNEQVKRLARELREIGTKLTMVVEKNGIGLDYLTIKLTDTLAANRLRDLERVINEEMASWDDCPWRRTAHRLAITSQPERHSKNGYCFFWGRPYYYVGASEVPPEELFSSGYRLFNKGRFVTILVRLYIMGDFWSIIDEICDTNVESYPIADELFQLGGMFLDAFPKRKIIGIEPFVTRITLSEDGLSFLGVHRVWLEQTERIGSAVLKRENHEVYDRFQIGEVKTLIQEAHEKMSGFIAAILEAKEKSATRELIVSGDANDLQLTVAGEPIPLSHNRSKRVVACLALLAEKEWFSVHEFSKLYFGREPHPKKARLDFDTVIRAFNKYLPGVGIEFEVDDAGNRQRKNFTVRVPMEISDVESVLGRLREHRYEK